jgi:hypothetical protein
MFGILYMLRKCPMIYKEMMNKQEFFLVIQV